MTKSEHSVRTRIGSILKGDQQFAQLVWKHKWFLLFVSAIGIVYITHSNSVRTASRRQQTLRDSLANARAEAMALSAELMRITSLTEIRKELQRRGSALREPTEPPIILKND